MSLADGLFPRGSEATWNETVSTPAQAMVLAAGLGTRLWPLTADRAKPAVPFLGRPLVAGVVDALRAHGVDRIVVNTHYRAESVRAALADVDVRFSHEATILGTAGCLAQALRLGHLEPDRPTLIVNGKLHLDMDLAAIVAGHTSSDAAVTMVLRPNPDREAFREVLVDEGHVVGFGEGRQPTGERPLLFTGVHVLSPEVLRSIPETFFDTVRDVYPALIEQGRVRAHVTDGGRWWELSTLERYVDLHARAIEQGLATDPVVHVTARVDPSASLTHGVVWEHAEVSSGCVLERVVVGAGVVLATNTRLRNMVVVRRDVVEEIERGEVLDGNVHVPLA